jgi:hypothetical protein
MNAFYEHHKNNIRFHYRCFDRLLLNGTIQPFQQEKRVLGFFWTYRQVYFLSPRCRLGRMFIRICPCLPFPVRLCLNPHYWLAQHMCRKGIRFRQSTNAFSQCSDPDAMQQLADSLASDDLQRCAQKWLPQLIPFFTPRERRSAGIDHRLFWRKRSIATT